MRKVAAEEAKAVVEGAIEKGLGAVMQQLNNKTMNIRNLLLTRILNLKTNLIKMCTCKTIQYSIINLDR